jgi:hypothetical protein
MSDQEEHPGRFWAKVIVPWLLMFYMVTMIGGQALIFRGMLPRWLANIVEFFYAPLGWLISIVD